MKITAVILNFNGAGNTIECLKSLGDCQKKDISLNIITVDNASSDNSPELLSKEKDITLIKNPKNLGYSGGMNVGMKEAMSKDADFILLLNNDILVDKHFFDKLMQYARPDAILCPKIYFAKGYEFHKKRYKKEDLGKVIWYAGGQIDWRNILGVHVGVDEVDSGQFSISKETDYATGACMLIPREVIQKVGYLDEKYFLYLEDMDYSVRAKNAGFKIEFVPGAVIWHKNASSAGGSGSILQDYYITRNRLIFAFKYAKLRTKLAVLKQTLGQLGQKQKKVAFFDFIFGNLGKGSFKV